MVEFSNKDEYVKEEDFDLLTMTEQGGKGQNWKEKLEHLISGKYFIPIVIVLIAIIAFVLGRISGLQDKRPPVRITTGNMLSVDSQNGEINTFANIQQTAAVGNSNNSADGVVVASKNGTKYHYPWCAGAKQISVKNLITFNSIEEAKAKGYTPASNCKGLK